MCGYMGITGHFILDWALKSVMICCKQVKGRHTADNIRMEYKEVISCFDLGHHLSCKWQYIERSRHFVPLDESLKMIQQSVIHLMKKIVTKQSLKVIYCQNHLRCFAHSLQ